MVALAPCLKDVPKLENLTIISNCLGYLDAAALASNMKYVAHLQELHLSLNSIGDDGTIALAGSLKDLTQLKNIDLCLSKIGTVVRKRLLLISSTCRNCRNST